MTLQALAESLGVETWKAMEIARWSQLHACQPADEPPLTEEEREWLRDKWPDESVFRWLDRLGYLNRARVRAAIAKEGE